MRDAAVDGGGRQAAAHTSLRLSEATPSVTSGP